jgi:hypothetical protein
MNALLLALALAPTINPTNWYCQLVCDALPQHECSGWRSHEAMRCSLEDDDPTACVRMTHPSAAGGREFRGVFDTGGLVSLAWIDSKGRPHTLFSR